MSLLKRARGVVGAGAAVLVVACQDAGPPTALTPEPNIGLTQPLDAPDPDALARTVPGFGGYFIDEAGRVTVYLTDPGARGVAERALERFLRTRGAGPADLRVLQGDYEWRVLRNWFERVTPEALSVPGAVFVDLDERENRVVIGVDAAVAEAGARAAAAGAAVPDAAVEVRVVPPILFAATLRDLVRPTQGGLQIHFSNFLCTLGFNAVSGGRNSFITNSHCTDQQGRVDGVAYYQPVSSVAGSFIGNEVADPRYFKGGICPKGRQCRFSDAARAEYADGVSFALGQIAQTTGANNGSLTIAGTLTITSEAGGTSFPIGSTANKIGRTTAWTQGEITNTCVNTNVSGSNITLLCQTFVAAGVGGGDSGSPVFIQTGGNNVQLAGILWGGNSAGTLFVFSPLASIEQELGALTTF